MTATYDKEHCHFCPIGGALDTLEQVSVDATRHDFTKNSVFVGLDSAQTACAAHRAQLRDAYVCEYVTRRQFFTPEEILEQLEQPAAQHNPLLLRSIYNVHTSYLLHTPSGVLDLAAVDWAELEPNLCRKLQFLISAGRAATSDDCETIVFELRADALLRDLSAPESRACELCGATTNVWLNLADGFIGCGRVQYGAEPNSGCARAGISAAQQHWQCCVENGLVLRLDSAAGPPNVFDYNIDSYVRFDNFADFQAYAFEAFQLALNAPPQLEPRGEEEAGGFVLKHDYLARASSIESYLRKANERGLRIRGITNYGNTCYIASSLQLLRFVLASVALPRADPDSFVGPLAELITYLDSGAYYPESWTYYQTHRKRYSLLCDRIAQAGCADADSVEQSETKKRRNKCDSTLLPQANDADSASDDEPASALQRFRQNFDDTDVQFAYGSANIERFWAKINQICDEFTTKTQHDAAEFVLGVLGKLDDLERGCLYQRLQVNRDLHMVHLISKHGRVLDEYTLADFESDLRHITNEPEFLLLHLNRIYASYHTGAFKKIHAPFRIPLRDLTLEDMPREPVTSESSVAARFFLDPVTNLGFDIDLIKKALADLDIERDSDDCAPRLVEELLRREAADPAAARHVEELHTLGYPLAHCRKALRVHEYDVAAARKGLAANCKRYAPSPAPPAKVIRAPQQRYRLKGCVIHSGYDLNYGHYYAILRIGEEWFIANDNSVQQVKEPTAEIANCTIALYEREVA